MSLPLRRAAVLLLAAACTPSTAPAPAPAAPPANHVARGTINPARYVPPPARGSRARPEACLPGEPFAAPSALAEEAVAALDAGARERALACADEALRLSPRMVPALTARGAALAALDRLDEARLAFARALAVDPDEPEALLGAAELHVRRLGSARDALEAGLEYAVRGVRSATRPPRKDKDLAARLELVAGMAENDLGRSHLALAHLDRALAARPKDPDALYERGVALFELCRFGEARRAFERALAIAPDDPWAIHQLGLVAERAGEGRRAAALLARARALAPDDFRDELAVDPGAFRAEVDAAVAALPAAEREALKLAPVEIQDLPDTEDLTAVEPPLSPSILGLYRGPPADEACTEADGPRCRSIVFYRKNLLRFARDRAELTEQVRVTLLHELGHLHGESDDELRDRGLE
ncbi:metallopeptidase family protein [Anaeromyxobacter sp. Red801]|uniref:metallopeptidase family protein n=1 Tax=Anaeromyxobacter sp. Red801 TaxID=3411632 RepID=UPI003BA16A79